MVPFGSKLSTPPSCFLFFPAICATLALSIAVPSSHIPLIKINAIKCLSPAYPAVSIREGCWHIHQNKKYVETMTPSLPSTPKAPWVVDLLTYSNPRKKLTTMALGLGDGVFFFCPADPDPAAFFFSLSYFSHFVSMLCFVVETLGRSAREPCWAKGVG